MLYDRLTLFPLGDLWMLPTDYNIPPSSSFLQQEEQEQEAYHSINLRDTFPVLSLLQSGYYFIQGIGMRDICFISISHQLRTIGNETDRPTDRPLRRCVWTKLVGRLVVLQQQEQPVGRSIICVFRATKRSFFFSMTTAVCALVLKKFFSLFSFPFLLPQIYSTKTQYGGRRTALYSLILCVCVFLLVYYYFVLRRPLLTRGWSSNGAPYQLEGTSGAPHCCLLQQHSTLIKNAAPAPTIPPPSHSTAVRTQPTFFCLRSQVIDDPFYRSWRRQEPHQPPNNTTNPSLLSLYNKERCCKKEKERKGKEKNIYETKLQSCGSLIAGGPRTKAPAFFFSTLCRRRE